LDAPADLHFGLDDERLYEQCPDPDVIWVDVSPCMLDHILPLAAGAARQVTIVAVPPDRLLQPTPWRLSWLLHAVWQDCCGLLLHMQDVHGTQLPIAWLFIFADQAARQRMLQGRIPDDWAQCSWSEKRPLQLNFGLTVCHGGQHITQCY
jgi:hypothetical protein